MMTIRNGADAVDEPMSCDVLVVGTGAGGLTAALTAADAGLQVLVVEATSFVGGTTALSGGGMWLPGNRVADAVLDEDPAVIEAYVDEVVGEAGDADLRAAFLAGAPKVVDALLEHPEFAVEWRPFPDYFSELEGAHPKGRAIFPLDIPMDQVGPIVSGLVRPPLPTTRGGHDTGDILSGGRALVGRLLHALESTDAELWTDAPLTSLEVTDGAVTGARIEHGTHHRMVTARLGVILAAGGFEEDHARRADEGHPVEEGWTMGAPGGTGGALTAAIDIGAAVDYLDACWWTPAFDTVDGPAFRVRDRGQPGSIVVDGRGQRYANESLPYDRLGGIMADRLRSGSLELPSWFIVDHRFIRSYGLNGLPAGTDLPAEWVHQSQARVADSIGGLADEIGVPAAALAETIERWNGFAKTGVDLDFGRGETAFDLFFGDPAVHPNPCLAPIAESPYVALPVILSDLGTKGGLRCDRHGQVLDTAGQPITGLYATGNTMAPWSATTYPGPGVPIGTSMTFGHLAASHLRAGATTGLA